MENGGYAILARLAKKSHCEQRHLLRMHEEAGFTEDESQTTEFRLELDQVLQNIMLRELRKQLDIATPEDDKPIPCFDKLLRDSPAFVQYLNHYLYFGVRFAAGGRPETSGPDYRGLSAINTWDSVPACRSSAFNRGTVSLDRTSLVSSEDS